MREKKDVAMMHPTTRRFDIISSAIDDETVEGRGRNVRIILIEKGTGRLVKATEASLRPWGGVVIKFPLKATRLVKEWREGGPFLYVGGMVESDFAWKNISLHNNNVWR